MKNKSKIIVFLVAGVVLLALFVFKTPFSLKTLQKSDSMMENKKVLLSIPVATASANSSTDLNVNFNPNGSLVSALQFDISLPRGISYKSIGAGLSAVSADKTVDANMVSGNVLRVIVFGLNKNAIASGHLATIKFSVVSSASSGTYPITFSNITASDPEATSVATDGISSSLVIN